MKTITDMSGRIFGRLTVVQYEHTSKTPNGTSNIWWLCTCTCGNWVRVRGGNLRSGNTTSCGCYQAEIVQTAAMTHNMSRTPTYKSWCAMHRRCTAQTDSRFRDYGGRGIKVCSRWGSFENFFADMGARPVGKTLDRKDVNGNYEPANCKWSTHTEQASNKRSRTQILTDREGCRVAVER